MCPPSVLLVEDSVPDALVAKSALRQAGNDIVEHCPSLNAAIDRLSDPERPAPIAVVLDLTLPDSAGIETYDRLASVGPPPVIVLTGDDDGDQALTLIERGAQDYLVKGQFSPATLSRAVRQAVERGRMRQQQREANERAETALRTQRAFIAAMSHEIRTPLSAILGMSDLLAATRLSLEQREFVEISRRCGRSLKALLDNVLEMARLESGQVQIEREPFRLDAAVEDCLEIFSNAAHQKGVALFSDLADEVVGTTVGDGSRLSQVLFNLVGNAVKFTSRGRIVVRARAAPEGPGVVIEVEDTGIGIPVARQAAVFERFVQAESGTTRAYGGSGLGLAICRDLVSWMGGRIEVKSREGVGSVFRCALPLSVEPVEPAVALAQRRILVAMADAVERDVTASRLRRSGAWVVAVSDGHEAEARLADGGFDAVLADLRLPRGSALDLFARVSGAGAEMHRVALVPMNHRAGDLARCQQVGAVALRKPARWEALLRSLRDGCVERRQQRAAPAPSWVGRCVLLAEDAPEMRVIAESLLRPTGCTVAVAADGERAAELGCDGSYDLILMDSHMPRVDGSEATRRIRAAERAAGRPPTPIVAVTADSLPEQKAALLEAGCDDHLAKPFTREELFETLGRFLESSDLAPVPELDLGEVPDVPADVADLAEEYLDRRRADADSLRDAVRSGDFEESRRLGHNMKGSGAGYGFATVSEIGASIERAADRADGAAIERLALALAEYAEKALRSLEG